MKKLLWFKSWEDLVYRSRLRNKGDTNKFSQLFSLIQLADEVEIVYEKMVMSFRTCAKTNASKRYIRKKAYVIILKE